MAQKVKLKVKKTKKPLIKPKGLKVRKITKKKKKGTK